MDFFINYIKTTYSVLMEIGIYLIIGLFFAGILKALISDQIIKKWLGGKGFMSVLKSALFGIPLPLCSCSVIPFSYTLKDKGASPGATTSFLISAPETGADSIAVTYSLLDPIFTVARPVAAFITSLVAGLLQNIFNTSTIDVQKIKDAKSTCCEESCCSGKINEKPRKESSITKIYKGIYYAFTNLLGDLANYITLGVLITGLVMVFIPQNYLAATQEYSILSMLIALVIGIPIYVCSTSSTPIVAALIVTNGLNPGAALVFLLAGPSTNMITINTVYKMMGKKGVIIYLSSIIFVTLLAGFSLDYIYKSLNIVPQAIVAGGGEFFPDWLKHIFAIILGLFLLYYLKGYFNWINKYFTSKKEKSH